MIEVSTSILSVKEGKESQVFLELENAKTDYFHIDVMDGKFVNKNTYNKMFSYASYIKRISNLPLDVHLMVEDTKSAIKDFVDLEPNIITFHLESCKNEKEVLETIELIKQNNTRVGISVKPHTPIEDVYPYLKYIHQVLVMTVEPGRGGQTFLTHMVEKIKKLKKHVDENRLEIDIEVDGGINLNTCNAVKQVGANVLVAGTAILMAKDYGEIIKDLKK